jgi:hypothetical protein
MRQEEENKKLREEKEAIEAEHERILGEHQAQQKRFEGLKIAVDDMVKHSYVLEQIRKGEKTEVAQLRQYADTIANHAAQIADHANHLSFYNSELQMHLAQLIAQNHAFYLENLRLNALLYEKDSK